MLLLLCGQCVRVGILTSWRPRPWYYVVTACSTNWTTLMMQHVATWTARWGGVGWDINVLTTTSLILRCQRMFHQLDDLDDATCCYVDSTVGWGGVEVGILTSWCTSLILRCQHMFHQLDDHDHATYATWPVRWKALQVARLSVENDADAAAHRPPVTAWPG